MWTILDTPAVAQAGRQLAHERGRDNLRFVSGSGEVTGAVDILFASGSLQYVEGPLLPERVRAMPDPPHHILLARALQRLLSHTRRLIPGRPVLSASPGGSGSGSSR